MTDFTWGELLWARIELWSARCVVHWYRRRGEHARAVAWAQKHYGRLGSRAVLR